MWKRFKFWPMKNIFRTEPVRVYLWLVYKITENNCCSQLFTELIQTLKKYRTSLDKIKIFTSSQKLPRELIPSETSHICRCGFKMRNVYYFSKIPGIVQRCFINTWSQKFQKMFKEALMKEWLFKWIWSSLACKFVEKRALVKGLCTPLNHEIFQNKLI